jgi:hypothetical protein
VLPDVIKISSRHKQDMMQVIAELLPNNPERVSIANAAAIAIDGAIVKAQLESQAGTELITLQGLSTILVALDGLAE